MKTKNSTILSIISSLVIVFGVTSMASAQTSGVLEIEHSTINPDAGTILVEMNQSSDDYAIFRFELFNDSNERIEAGDLNIEINTQGTNTRRVIDEAVISIGDFEYAATRSKKVNADTYSYKFNQAINLSPDQRKTVSLILSFNPGEDYKNPQFIKASVKAADISLSEDILINGSATSAQHELHTPGVFLESFTTQINSVVEDGDNNDYIEAVVEMTLGAFESDVYLDKKLINRALNFGFTNQVMWEEAFGEMTIVSTEGGIIDGDNYVIMEGENETFTVTAKFVPEFNGFYRLENELIKFRFDGDSDERFALKTPDLKTGYVSIDDRLVEVNNTPIANPDKYEVSAGDDSVYDLVTNDVDEDGDELRITSVTSSTKDIKVALRRDNTVRISVLPRTVAGRYDLSYVIWDGQDFDFGTVTMVVN